MATEKKMHHYVPKAYLKAFADNRKFIQVYLKDHPEKSINQSIDKVGRHLYYYSTPRSDGGRDNNSLDDLFSKLEDKWPLLVEKIRRKEDICLEDRAIFLAFMALQRARVPATRDLIEKVKAEEVKFFIQGMDAAGKLPPKPIGLENILDHIKVAIDPYQSLLLMKNLVEGFIRLFSKICFSVLHNKSEIEFLTSDNPVIWFDPSIKETEARPYTWMPGGPVVLLFPIAPDCLIYGDTQVQENGVGHKISHTDLEKSRIVMKINRQVCRFAYEAVFSQQRGHEVLVKEFADVSPVPHVEQSQENGVRSFKASYIFGERKKKIKW